MRLESRPILRLRMLLRPRRAACLAAHVTPFVSTLLAGVLLAIACGAHAKPPRGSVVEGDARRTVGAEQRTVGAEQRTVGAEQRTDPSASIQVRTASALAVWLRGTRIAPSDVGLIAVPVEGGEPLVALSAGQQFNPASTMKLVTTLAALSMLGPEHRWTTGAYLRGNLQGDVLAGDLVLRGGGDPKLVVEDLAEFIARMRAAGLREIRGDLVVDDGLFDAGRDSVEAFDGDPSQPYNVRPHALLMNFKAARLAVRPGEGGADFAFDPPLADVAVDSDLRIIRGPCRSGAAGLSVRDGGRQDRVRVWGSYSAACGEQGVFVSVLSHRQFIHALFKAAWRAAGGVWEGRTRFERGAASGPTWLEWTSPRTLADVVRDINKFSNNVMARQVFLMLSPDLRHRPATLERSRAAVRDWLGSQGLDLRDLEIDNGSGLSRTARISPGGMARLLQFAAAGPFADLLRGSLPEVGVDGTMKNRLVGEPVAGRAWIKTGSLADVRAVAGYVDAASGRRYVVVLFVNGPRVEAARPLQDRFLRWVHDKG